MISDLLITNIATLYTMQGEDLGKTTEAALSILGAKLNYFGNKTNAPSATQTIDATGCIVIPGLVDAHTHAIWAGSRSDEFARRLQGVPYSEILEQGGGILSTVSATRKASMEHLAELGQQRLQSLFHRGVTSVEVKSGYGLSVEHEDKILSAIQSLIPKTPMRISPTFLGAHTIPKEFRSKRSEYVSQIIEEQIPRCASKARFIDVYCDRGAFDLDESIAILEAGRAHGLGIKAHSEQVVHTGISSAAAKLGAVSVEHLERATETDCANLATYGTTAVLLPGAQFYLKDSAPPVQTLREYGVAMAIGSDLNPGSSPVHDLWSCATMACILQGFTPTEAILGITLQGGKAIADPKAGFLGLDSHADCVIIRPPPGEPPTYESIIQHLNGHRVEAVISNGKIIFSNLPTL